MYRIVIKKLYYIFKEILYRESKPLLVMAYESTFGIIPHILNCGEKPMISKEGWKEINKKGFSLEKLTDSYKNEQLNKNWKYYYDLRQEENKKFDLRNPKGRFID